MGKGDHKRCMNLDSQNLWEDRCPHCKAKGKWEIFCEIAEPCNIDRFITGQLNIIACQKCGKTWRADGPLAIFLPQEIPLQYIPSSWFERRDKQKWLVANMANFRTPSFTLTDLRYSVRIILRTSDLSGVRCRTVQACQLDLELPIIPHSSYLHEWLPREPLDDASQKVTREDALRRAWVKVRL